MLKVGLIGVGGISGAHIPGWLALDEVELVALCDVRPEQMEKYPDIRNYTNFDEMLQNEELDILDICLPTFLHVEYAIKAMENRIKNLRFAVNVLEQLQAEGPYDYSKEIAEAKKRLSELQSKKSITIKK